MWAKLQNQNTANGTVIETNTLKIPQRTHGDLVFGINLQTDIMSNQLL